jgi:ATP-dependent Clp protease ATP-binding subunit ClpA
MCCIYGCCARKQDKALERRFQQVYVGQPTVEDTISILRGLKERYEMHHKVCLAVFIVVNTVYEHAMQAC